MLSAIKEAVKQTLENEKLTDFTVGTVSAVNPIKIQINQKFVLGKNQLVISERLTNHFTYMTAVEDNFDNLKDQGKYEARKKYIVYGGLKVGDNVILARKAGGQKYYVLDRAGVV